MPQSSVEKAQDSVEKQYVQTKNQLFTLFQDLYRLFVRANKPTRKSFFDAARVVLLGVLIMGFVGFVVKIMSIPINNILIGK